MQRLIFEITFTLFFLFVLRLVYDVYHAPGTGSFEDKTKYVLRRYVIKVKQFFTSMNLKDRVIIGGILVVTLTLSDSWKTTPILSLVGCAVGFGAIIMLRSADAASRRFQLTDELIFMAESIEIYINSGVPLQKALMTLSQSCVLLRGPLEKCVREWGRGTNEALESFGAEVGTREAAAVVTILRHINMAGSSNISGVLKSEASKMSQLYQYQQDRSISRTPIFFNIYKILPFVSIFVMIAGGFMWKLMNSLQGIMF